MYQDVWVKGKLVAKGRRECEQRYLAIRNELRRMRIDRRRRKKPISVLDIGAANGYFSFRLAEDFGARVTMIESAPAIVKWLRKNDNPNVTLVHKTVSVEDLLGMAKHEHYDVVLALSVLHHFADYAKAIRAVFQLGDVVFVEPPSLAEAKGGYHGHRATGIISLLSERPHRIVQSTTNLRGLGERPLMVFDQSI